MVENRFEKSEDLAVHVVDRGREEKQRDNEPAETRMRGTRHAGGEGLGHRKYIPLFPLKGGRRDRDRDQKYPRRQVHPRSRRVFSSAVFYRRRPKSRKKPSLNRSQSER